MHRPVYICIGVDFIMPKSYIIATIYQEIFKTSNQGGICISISEGVVGSIF